MLYKIRHQRAAERGRAAKPPPKEMTVDRAISQNQYRQGRILTRLMPFFLIWACDSVGMELTQRPPGVACRLNQPREEVLRLGSLAEKRTTLLSRGPGFRRIATSA